MKKVLILCRDFPPLDTVAAQRPHSWYKYFAEFDLFPVVITINWAASVKHLQDKFKSVPGSEEVQKTVLGECHRLSPKRTKRNELIAKHGLENKILQRKMLTYKDLFLSQLNLKNNELYFLYAYSRNFLAKNKIDLIIATGGPFILFKMAHKLSEEFDIPWVADYRDEWSGNHSVKNYPIVKRLFYKLGSLREKHYTNNALFFTTVSPPLLSRISKCISKDGYLLRNGIDLNLLPEKSATKEDTFTLIYAGTLYDFEYLNILFEGLSKFFTETKPSIGQFKLKMIGIELNKTSGTDRFLKFSNKYKDYIDILPAMPHKDVLVEEAMASVMLNLVPSSIAQGIYTVKLYEYLALKKPVINIETNKGAEDHEFTPYVNDCRSTAQFRDSLTSLFNAWQANKLSINQIGDEVINTFDRKLQTGILSEIIHQQVPN